VGPLAGTRAALTIWRAVEAQHVVSTMLLVDTSEEQRILEELLDLTKPPLPEPATGLHYLLFTPFRYPPTGQGSRFRRPEDPGVFYGADAPRTACAELGYWRWRFLLDSPDLDSLDPAPQTVFQVSVGGLAVDLREPPFVRQRRRWTDPVEYEACQRLASGARDRGIDLIRYESVRDPEHGGAAALLTPAAFRSKVPRVEETWYLAVRRDRVRWSRSPGVGFEFSYPI
jgi:hypothetical protein